MSIIQNIRDKAAWIVIGAIALALIAFIVQDAFQNGNLFNETSTVLGVVDGEEISAIEFEERFKRAEEVYRQQGYPMNDMMRNNIREGLWNEYVEDAIMSDKYEALGLTVSDKELSDILYGENPPQDLRQQFTDPNTGQYDPNAAYQQIQALRKQKNSQYASFFEQYLPALAKNRQKEKYTSLLSNSTYVPKWLVEKEEAGNNQRASVNFVFVPYSTVNDSAVNVTNEAIAAYLKQHEEEFKEEASRTIEYVMFDAGPTAADSAEILSQAQAIRDEFATTTNIQAFLVRNGSEIPYNDVYQLKSRINMEHLDSVINLKEGEIAGPFLENGNYVLARLMGKRTMPDSVKARHILIKTADQGRPVLPDSTAKKRIDSIASAINNGADFNEMVIKYSDDPGSKETGGEYDFSSSQFAGISKEFAEAIFYGFAGDEKIVKVENPSYAGYHYIEVLRQKGFEQAYNIALMAKAIVPSQETINRQNGLASQFAAESRNEKDFDANAKKHNYNKIIATDLKPLDAIINGLGSSREVVKWAYETEPGKVAEIPFQVDDKFVVPILTRAYEAGLMPVEKARPMVESIVRNKEKAKRIKSDIGQVTTLDAVAQKTGQQVSTEDSLRFSAPFIANVGQEPKLVGASFNKAYQTAPSGAIEGNGGVFSVKVNEVRAITDTTAGNIEQRRSEMLQSLERTFSDPRVVTEIFKEKVKIEDHRHRFF